MGGWPSISLRADPSRFPTSTSRCSFSCSRTFGARSPLSGLTLPVWSLPRPLGAGLPPPGLRAPLPCHRDPVRPAPLDPKQRILRIGEDAPDWAAHRLRLRPLGDPPVAWWELHWIYLGAHDAFAMPEGELARELEERGFEIWWEGRRSREAPWEFVEIQRVAPKPRSFAV